LLNQESEGGPEKAISHIPNVKERRPKKFAAMILPPLIGGNCQLKDWGKRRKEVWTSFRSIKGARIGGEGC